MTTMTLLTDDCRAEIRHPRYCSVRKVILGLTALVGAFQYPPTGGHHLCNEGEFNVHGRHSRSTRPVYLNLHRRPI